MEKNYRKLNLTATWKGLMDTGVVTPEYRKEICKTYSNDYTVADGLAILNLIAEDLNIPKAALGYDGHMDLMIGNVPSDIKTNLGFPGTHLTVDENCISDGVYRYFIFYLKNKDTGKFVKYDIFDSNDIKELFVKYPAGDGSPYPEDSEHEKLKFPLKNPTYILTIYPSKDELAKLK